MNSEVIILRQIKFQESSIIVHALTDDYGKISILIKGAYNRRGNILSSFETLSISNLILSQGRNMFYYCDIIDSISQDFLYSDPISFRVAHFVSEVILKTMIDNFSVPNIYFMTKEFILRLKEAKSKVLLVAAWLIKFSSFMGYRPVFDYGKDYVYLSGEGIVSYNAENYSIGLKKIDKKLAEFIEILLKLKFVDISKIALDENEALIVLESIFYYFIMTVDNIKINAMYDLQKFLKVDSYGCM